MGVLSAAQGHVQYPLAPLGSFLYVFTREPPHFPEAVSAACQLGQRAGGAVMRAAGEGVAHKNLQGVRAIAPGTRSWAHSPLSLEGPLSFDIQDPRAVQGK